MKTWVHGTKKEVVVEKTVPFEYVIVESDDRLYVMQKGTYGRLMREYQDAMPDADTLYRYSQIVLNKRNDSILKTRFWYLLRGM